LAIEIILLTNFIIIVFGTKLAFRQLFSYVPSIQNHIDKEEHLDLLKLKSKPIQFIAEIGWLTTKES
jgi:hypothetical protein